MANQRTLVVICSAVLLLIVAGPAPAPIVSKAILKEYFETGDTPTEGQFGNLIDSFVHFEIVAGPTTSEHIIRAVNGGVLSDAGGTAVSLDVGELFDPSTQALLPEAGIGGSSAWPGTLGFLGFQFQVDDINGIAQPHNGYLQMSVDSAASSTPYAVRVTGIAYETTPNTPIRIAAIVPQHAALPSAIVALSVLGLWRGRRPIRFKP